MLFPKKKEKEKKRKS